MNFLSACETKQKEDVRGSAKDWPGIDLNNGEGAQFIRDAGEFSLQQIRLCELAQQNSINPKVRTMGKTLEKEYIQLYSLLKDLGVKKNIRIPIDLRKKRKKILKVLKYEIAEDFDRKFFEIIVRDHRNAIKSHQKFQNRSKDPDIAELIKKTLPQLKRNLAFILLNLSSIIEAKTIQGKS